MVDCLNLMLITYYNEIMKHDLYGLKRKKDHMSKISIKLFNDVWFQKTCMGKIYSFGIHVMIITNINELKGKKNINKIDIASMEMEQTLIPRGGH